MDEYLKPGFDPRSLKVPQLRRILTENNVEFPSHSKKALLVRLFEENVGPKLRKLRKKHAKALSNRNNEGVRTRSSARTKSGDSSDESSKKSRKRRVSSANVDDNEDHGKNEDNEDAEGDVKMKEARPSSTRTSNLKNKNKKRKRIGDDSQNTPITEKVAKKSPSKSPRKSLVIEKFESSESASESASSSFSNNREENSPTDLSHLKVSDAFAAQWKKALENDEKVEFVKGEQGGALPAEMKEDVALNSPLRISTPELPTHKLVDETEERVKKLEKDVQPEVKEESPRLNVKRKEPEINKKPMRDQELEVKLEEPEDKIQNNEEPDVKEEEEEEEADEPKNPKEEPVEQITSMPSFWKRSFKFIGKSVYNLLVFSLIVSPILYGLWYRESRISVGYCGQELPPPSLPERLGTLPFSLPTPKCLPCPDHALCYPRMQLKCKPEYALRRNPLSLYGLLPLSDACIKDSERERLIGEVVDKSLQFLRVKNARVACGECDDDVKCGILEDELYQIFHESKAPWINDEEFDELWIQAVADLKKEPEITWRQVSTTDFLKNFALFTRIFDTNIDEFWQSSESEYRILRDSQNQNEADDISGQKGYFPKAGNQTGIFRSTSKKYIGLRCKFENEIYRTCYRNRKLIIPLVLGALFGKFLLSVNRRLRQEKIKVDKLTKKVVDRLKNTKRTEDSETPFLSTVQLRDVLLSDVVDLKYKNRLWQKTSKRLEHNNTNIKSSLMEIHGEIMKCWEWVGPLEDVRDDKDTGNRTH
ncbi:hypothetical protein ZYGR_0AK05920 [Zygosaccharomyces rouxii]|uniref:Inner nuclear membrane protein SRC1 n=1 Tax=Zygosaccharomyces rouxii TaxID=4956 RepID=A0A1Q3AEL4_ZYGRO|nr:hypothetical protein ZYGR_0AK05920 [Zygosaccharomyces rouxii]